MQKETQYAQDSITALATPWGESALAVIRVSGADSLELLSGLFRPRDLTAIEGHSVLFGRIQAPGGEVIDEVMVAVYKEPRSYTGENSAEIIFHGSPAIAKKLLSLLHENGFRFAGPGEFTLRAFLNGKMGLTQAEAVNEIVRAKTDRARAVALNRLSGSIERKIEQIKEGLLGLLAAVEVRIDYGEDDFEEEDTISEAEVNRLEEDLEKLLSTYGIGKILQEGIPVVLAGPTNAGKSTLFNRFLREDRAIVSEVHGTTRDYLEGVISVEGIPVRLYDTAGYRESSNPLDHEGIKRTDKIVRNAHLIIYLVDSEAGLSERDEEFFSSLENPNRLIRVWNKVDLTGAAPPVGFIPLSAEEGDGIDELTRAIAERVWFHPPGGLGGGNVDMEEPIIDSLRQKELLERAAASLREFRSGLKENKPLDVLAVDLKEALDGLGEITGEVTSQDILNNIFANFCVGK